MLAIPVFFKIFFFLNSGLFFSPPSLLPNYTQALPNEFLSLMKEAEDALSFEQSLPG